MKYCSRGCSGKQLGPSKFENDVYDVMDSVSVLNISEPIEDNRDFRE